MTDFSKLIKSFFWIAISVLLLTAFVPNDSYREVRNKAFTTGERLEYRVHYGFITAGEAIISVDDKIHEKNGKPCFRVNIFGRSTSAFDIALRIRDNWGSYFDTTSLIPQQFYRTIEEGKYRKNEVVYFDHKNHSAEVKVWDRKKNKYKEPKNYRVPYGVHDMVSGYYYLRNVNYSKVKKGEIITIPAFFEDTIYNFKVKYAGKETIETKQGEMKAIKLVPLMPDNKLFRGENSIRVWLSDDPNKIPLKIQADMFVGAVEIDIKKYSGLRN